MLVVRPPEYFPGIAFLAELLHAERFVLADTYQYSRQSFQNRARLRTPQGWQWVSVPLKGGQHGTPIVDVAIRSHLLWHRAHLRSLMYNYRSAPFYHAYAPGVQALLQHPPVTLGALTCHSVTLMARWLGVAGRLVSASRLPGRPDTLPAILGILEGPVMLLTRPEARSTDSGHGVPVAVGRFTAPTYRQTFDGFQPDLSALDLLFNYGPDARRIIRESLDIEVPT